jgi:hypothetical protein
MLGIGGNQLAGRGGRREGAGRRPGSVNRVTAEVRDLALEHGPAAVRDLARLCEHAQSETARVSACNAILERSYGKSVAGRPIRIDLPDTSNPEGITKAIAAIVRAVAGGEITPNEASDLCGILEAQRRAIELSDIEGRIAQLEAAKGVRR